MPDYIYLLENRLSADQQNALRQLRGVAREGGYPPLPNRRCRSGPNQRPRRS